MAILGSLLILLIEIYTFVIIAAVIVTWLIAFDVISMRHPATYKLVSLLGRLTDPVLKPVQRFIPSIGGIDISPIIVIFGLMLLKRLVAMLLIYPAYV